MTRQRKFVCPSETCRREIEIEIAIGDAAENAPSPICTCGVTMKKVYTVPVVLKLSKEESVRSLGIFEQANGSA
jgi:hypothetical protein